MNRWSEMVLPGHPDKLCDQLADALLASAYTVDPEAYGQVEVGIWGDRLWLSGALCTREPLTSSIEETVQRAGALAGTALDRFTLDNHLCALVKDPREWSAHVNDQALVIGWAGYDAKTRWLAPEHFIAHRFREALTGLGPDGKLLVKVREESGGWHLEDLIATVQQSPEVPFFDLCTEVSQVLAQAWDAVRTADPRWKTPWNEVTLLVNPNGPLLNGGSEGDNGQTGRKLVMDYYGPRVSLGGGALSGKHLTHIDRLAAYNARLAAVRAVATGAQECLVQLAYAPNVHEPLGVDWKMEGGGITCPDRWFGFEAMAGRFEPETIRQDLGRGLHFWDPDLPWNRGG